MIKIKIEPIEIIESVILYYEEKIYRDEHPERFTKFDSDNDIFLGTIGEFAFSRYLKDRGYEYLSNYWDNKNLPDDAKKEINGRTYDLYDFGIQFSKGKDIKIDVKTQYCIALKYYNENWQMAVNENTINKIRTGYRKIDYFVFIFSDKESSKYIEHIEKRFKTNDSNKIIELLESYKGKSEKLFNSFSVDIIGAIEVEKFISLSTSFKENEVFRINLQNKNNRIKPLYWKTQSAMSRIYIKYLINIDRLVIPLNINLCKEKPNNSKNFKEWFESVFKYESSFVKVFIDEEIYIKFPENGFIKGIQYATYIDFLDDVIKKFNNSKYELYRDVNENTI